MHKKCDIRSASMLTTKAQQIENQLNELEKSPANRRLWQEPEAGELSRVGLKTCQSSLCNSALGKLHLLT